MNRILERAVFLLAVIFLLSACSSFYKNPELKQYNPQSGYRFENLERGDNSDDLFVILTFSGGGTRAAAFTFGVLEGLRDTAIKWPNGRQALLDEVDIISSISGGSFTAAYYGLFGDKTFSEFPERFLNRPIEDDLVGLLFSPVNWFKLAGGSFGRSDLAAELYDQEIFQNATFADLIARNKRPFIVINSTDMTLGLPFSFIQDQFDLICSDLAGLPVARAVAASSAFPGLLTPLTFQNYAGNCQYKQPRWVEFALRDREARINPRRTARAERRLSYTAEGQARRDYIHLVDGGVADNIGLRGPLTSIRSVNYPWSVLRMINNKRIKRLVVIVVNAATNPVTDRDKSADVPGLVDTLSTAATVPLDNYSFDTLELLKATFDKHKEEQRLIKGCERLAAEHTPPCKLKIRAPYKIDFYPVQVDFDRIMDKEQREWFKNLPTSFQLPRATIEKLVEAGRNLLKTDPQFKRLMKDIGATQ